MTNDSKPPPTNIFLAEGQPTLFFFVLFVSFVVQAFFLKRPFRGQKGASKGDFGGCFEV
jgi:hypothetical protein